METRFFLRASAKLRPPLSQLQRRLQSSSTTNYQQVNPIGDYYASILSSTSSPSITPPPTSSPTRFNTKSVDSTAEPAIIFSSRLSSPLERRTEIQNKSVLIAGIWVPPKPTEPENCCMSGCVNCVWDRYGEEVEEWASAKKAADVALKNEKRFEKGKKKREISGSGLMLGEGEKAQHTAVSMDDEGGGSESNWATGSANDDLFRGLPVGIREFMKQEKRLKEKHAKEGTSGG